jgi:hypothetical protein
MAWVAYVVFLRRNPREAVPELDRRVALLLALGVIAFIALGFACDWWRTC